MPLGHDRVVSQSGTQRDRHGSAQRGAALECDEGFLELGVCYGRFAARNHAHFEVMFRPELHRSGAPEVVEQR